MLSLVAYGSSDDESETEEEVGTVVQAPKPNSSVSAGTPAHTVSSDRNHPLTANGSTEKDIKQSSQASSKNSTSEETGSSSSTELFSKLPAPSSKADFISGSSIVSKKKSGIKGPVRILVPSLPEFDEEDEPPAKKKAQAQIHKSTTGTKLMSMLPAPKGGTISKETKPSLVPQSITRKPAAPIKPRPPVKKPTPATTVKPKGLAGYEDSGDESGDDGPTDFFSLTADHSVPTAEPTAVPTNDLSTAVQHQQPLYQNLASSSSDPEQPNTYPQYSAYAETAETSSAYAEPQADSGQDHIGFGASDLQLDDEAIQKLCGRKGKRDENVQIIDVNGDEIMPDSKEWMTKQLTQERPNRSHRKGFGPSSQQRRKHQITYLAFQAKENEIELQNQWANNRQSRRQTQSKYGF